jgi:hypothetical protein
VADADVPVDALSGPADAPEGAPKSESAAPEDSPTGDALPIQDAAEPQDVVAAAVDAQATDGGSPGPGSACDPTHLCGVYCCYGGACGYCTQ